MVKANPIIEALGLIDFFYKDMDVVFVKIPNSNKVEKHYYKTDSEGHVVIDSNPANKSKNPVIRGKDISIDTKTKRNMYKLTLGSDYVSPLFQDQAQDKQFLDTKEVNLIFNAGMEWQRQVSENKERENEVNKLAIYFIIIGLMILVNLFLTYQLADKAGVLNNLFVGAKS